MNKSEAQREHEREEYERKQEAWKAQIIGSPVEMSFVINSASDLTRLKIMRLIANLTDAGLELRNKEDRTALPAYPLTEQTLDMVEELAETVKQAIEEYISDDTSSF